MTPIDAFSGGRFPSDLQVPRDDARNASPSSSSSNGAGAVATAGTVPGSAQDEYMRSGQDPYRLDGVDAGTRPGTATTETYTEQAPLMAQQSDLHPQPQQPEVSSVDPQQEQSFLGVEPVPEQSGLARPNSSYGDWMGPAAAGVAGAGAGAAGYAAYQNRDTGEETPQQETLPTRDMRETYHPTGAPVSGPPKIGGAYYVEDTPAAFNAPEPAQATPAAIVSNPIEPHPSSTVTPTQATSAAAITSDPARSLPTSTTAPAVAQDPRSSSTSYPLGSTPSATTPALGESTPLGGLEREGAHETGHIFPKVVRHDTDISVSNLHVPGKFPKTS